MPKHVLIAGCGFVGRASAELFRSAGWEVTGLTHSEESAALRSAEGLPAIAADVSDLESLRGKVRGDWEVIIDCVSSGRGGADAYRRAYLEGARNLTALWPDARFIFTSSTSVYPQTDGGWVTERSPAEPGRETAQILRETEELVLRRGGTVARLAGIYGPGRSVLLRRFFDGTARIEGDGLRYLNQIHRDDAAAALFHLGSGCQPAGIYNVADDEPIAQRDCYAWLATYFRRPLPQVGPIDANRKRAWTSKRVSNARLQETGWRCAYPSFRSAIAMDPRLIAESGGAEQASH